MPKLRNGKELQTSRYLAHHIKSKVKWKFT